MYIKIALIFPLNKTCNPFIQFWLVWCMRGLINIIYTLHNQLPDFMSTSNQEQLFDREKLMMSCPESSAGSPTQWGLSVNNRMSATEGPLFGEATCQSSLRQRGSRWAGQSEKVPAQQVRGPGSETPSGVKKSCEWATETKWWHPEGKLAKCTAEHNKGTWIHVAIRTSSVYSSRQMVLIKDVRRLFLSKQRVCLCV